MAAKFQGWSNAGEVATKDPLAFIAAEAVAVLPLHSASSEVLNGIVFRAAARRRLRIHIPRSNLYSFKALANVADLEVRGRRGASGRAGGEVLSGKAAACEEAGKWCADGRFISAVEIQHGGGASAAGAGFDRWPGWCSAVFYGEG